MDTFVHSPHIFCSIITFTRIPFSDSAWPPGGRRQRALADNKSRLEKSVGVGQPRQSRSAHRSSEIRTMIQPTASPGVPELLTRERYERWVRLYARELFAVCLRRVGGNSALAEELLADVWLVAWHKRAEFSGDDAGGRRWLYRIAWMAAPRIWRKNPAHAEMTPALTEQVRQTLWSEEQVEADPTGVARLHACFQELHTLDQSILQLRFGLRPDPEAPELPAGLAWAEIATMLPSLHPGSVKTDAFQPDQMRMRANRSMQRLRQCIERGGHSEVLAEER